MCTCMRISGNFVLDTLKANHIAAMFSLGPGEHLSSQRVTIHIFQMNTSQETEDFSLGCLFDDGYDHIDQYEYLTCLTQYPDNDMVWEKMSQHQETWQYKTDVFVHKPRRISLLFVPNILILLMGLKLSAEPCISNETFFWHTTCQK